MFQRIILLTLLFLVVLSCTSDQEFTFQSTGNQEYPEISIHNLALKTPLVIAAGDSGSIFFETIDGRHYLKGEPKRVEQKEGLLALSWEVEERTISIEFKQENDYVSMHFAANPAEDILAWGLGLSASESAYYNGLFERTVDGDQKESWKEGIKAGMNLRGQAVDMIIKPTLSLYSPFYLSSEGYGMFMEGTWPGKYDFCKTDPKRVLVKFEGEHLNARFYLSDKPAEIVKSHALHVGPTIVPPRWAFTPWRWRDNHVNLTEYFDGTPVNAPYNSQLVEDILMMEAYDIPCGVYWVDRPWAIGTHGYADFTWDPERFPRAEEMIDWLHQRDQRFLLWIAPWVTGDMMQTAIDSGYTQPLIAHHGIDSATAALLDFTNSEAVKWWQENGIEKMLKQGVDGFKLDRSEETVPETRDVILADGRTAREVRNQFPVLYVKAVNESSRKIKGNDFVLIPRAGYTGSAQYSGFWGGDIGSPPEGLRAAIIALQRSSLNGYSIWGSDIGGYWQGDLDREVLARWLAFGCFNPIMEVGPTEDRAPWDMDSAPNYDTELIAIWRLYAKLHDQLADYSHQLAQEAHETGMPVARPLFLEYPEQAEAWMEWQNFTYGSDILVHAIWEKGTDSTSVYLPAGSQWRDAWNTDMVYEGGQKLNIKTPLHKIPIFIIADSDLDLGDLSKLYQESLEIASKKPDLKALEEKAFN